MPRDKDSAFQHLAVLYIRYIGIFRKLEESYDQIIHPQKRRLLRRVLEAVMGRLIQVKAVSLYQISIGNMILSINFRVWLNWNLQMRMFTMIFF